MQFLSNSTKILINTETAMLSCFHHFTFKCKKAKWNQCLIVHQMIERKRWRLLQCNNGSLKDFKTEQRGQYCAITCFVWNHIVWNEFWSKSLNPINRSGIIGLVWKKDALIIKRQLDRPMMASKVRGIPEAGNRKGTESGLLCCWYTGNISSCGVTCQYWQNICLVIIFFEEREMRVAFGSIASTEGNVDLGKQNIWRKAQMTQIEWHRISY